MGSPTRRLQDCNHWPDGTPYTKAVYSCYEDHRNISVKVQRIFDSKLVFEISGKLIEGHHCIAYYKMSLIPLASASKTVSDKLRL